VIAEAKRLLYVSTTSTRARTEGLTLTLREQFAKIDTSRWPTLRRNQRDGESISVPVAEMTAGYTVRRLEYVRSRHAELLAITQMVPLA